jgi:hypothetical protein
VWLEIKDRTVASTGVRTWSAMTDAGWQALATFTATTVPTTFLNSAEPWQIGRGGATGEHIRLAYVEHYVDGTLVSRVDPTTATNGDTTVDDSELESTPGTPAEWTAVNLANASVVTPSSGTGGPDLSDATPQPAGTAAAGTSADASRADHVHAIPAQAFGSLSHRGWGKLSAESGTWAIASGLYLQSSASANTDYLEWAFLPLGGTYTINLAVFTGSNMGQYRVSIDGVDVGSLVEGYAASGAYTSLEVGTGIVVAPGVHTVRISVPSKNASSSAHVMRFISIDFTRTA